MTLKERIIETIQNNSLIQHVLFYKIDDGNTNDNNSEEDTSNSFDSTDPNLVYFTYTVNEEDKTVEVTSVNGNLLVNTYGDITIPDTLGNYTTVLVAS